MKMLAAQARFAQWQRQMRMPIGELPPDLLHAVGKAGDGEESTGDSGRRNADGLTGGKSRSGVLAVMLAAQGVCCA